MLIGALVASGASAFVMIDNWFVSDLSEGSVDTSLNLDIEDLPSDEDIKVIWTIPELDIRVSKGPYDPIDLRHARIARSFEIPWDAEPGEYVVRLTITDSEGNKRIRHRFVEVE